MALVEKYHVVAAVRPVATGASIKEGQFVALDDSGDVVLQQTQGGSGMTNTNRPYGVAGDTKITSASYMPGVVSGWQNRVSDYFDETRASGRMTVYHSGGEFATDQFSVNVASLLPGALLFAQNGILHDRDQAGKNDVWLGVAMLTQAAGFYPSGVPGTDVNGDIALAGEEPSPAGAANNNEYIEFKLLI